MADYKEALFNLQQKTEEATNTLINAWRELEKLDPDTPKLDLRDLGIDVGQAQDGDE